RNLAAHLCFGTETLQQFPQNIFPGLGPAFPADYSALDDMRAAGLLTDCEIPLALVYWTSSGLVFLDAWAVRRALIPSAASAKWAPFVSPRRLAESLACFLQFQKQVEELQANLPQSQLASAVSIDYFRYLTALGFLPIAGVKSSIGFDYLQFFTNLTFRDPVFIEGASLDSLFGRSLRYPPIDLTNQEMFWLYRVRENMEAVAGSTLNQPRPYMIFTNGHIGFQGDAHYDLNYWDYANYD
ncbi:MAG TPA: hypothetical protein VNH19_13580, partial [Candidatus Limnocylindrales bacterium]|nr:hypothetical protein [Candidatus Limnocylindrales bacterium]